MSIELPQNAPPPAAAPSGATKVPKNPLVAAGLSFVLAGLGQVYNGQPARAFVFFAGFVSAIYAAAEIDPMPFAFFIPFVFFYNVIDAYRGAALANARAAGGTVEAEDLGTESPVWGGSLIVIGLVFLANNLGWFHLADLKRYWPVLLVAAGSTLIYRSLRRRKALEGGDAGKV